jgi:hypothetical protein
MKESLHEIKPAQEWLEEAAWETHDLPEFHFPPNNSA